VSNFNLKSSLLQITFLVISALAVFMLYTCMRQSKIDQSISLEKTLPATSISQKQITKSKNKTPTPSIQKTPNIHSATGTSNLPVEHIATINQTLNNNFSLEGVKATKREDGTVILHSEGKLQTVSVARIDENGNLIFEEHNQPISSDLTGKSQ